MFVGIWYFAAKNYSAGKMRRDIAETDTRKNFEIAKPSEFSSPSPRIGVLTIRH